MFCRINKILFIAPLGLSGGEKSSTEARGEAERIYLLVCANVREMKTSNAKRGDSNGTLNGMNKHHRH
jgi:hypothetical protein